MQHTVLLRFGSCHVPTKASYDKKHIHDASSGTIWCDCAAGRAGGNAPVRHGGPKFALAGVLGIKLGLEGVLAMRKQRALLRFQEICSRRLGGQHKLRAAHPNSLVLCIIHVCIHVSKAPSQLG